VKIILSEKYCFEKEQAEKDFPFNREKLFSAIEKYLDSQGTERRKYFLGTPDKDGQTSLYEERNFWVVSYSERGKRYDSAFFDSVSDAVDFFIWKFTKPPTVDWTKVF